jgi:hypothetical protein
MTFNTFGFVLYSIAVFSAGYGIGYWASRHADAYRRDLQK